MGGGRAPLSTPPRTRGRACAGGLPLPRLLLLLAALLAVGCDGGTPPSYGERTSLLMVESFLNRFPGCEYRPQCEQQLCTCTGGDIMARFVTLPSPNNGGMMTKTLTTCRPPGRLCGATRQCVGEYLACWTHLSSPHCNEHILNFWCCGLSSWLGCGSHALPVCANRCPSTTTAKCGPEVLENHLLSRCVGRASQKLGSSCDYVNGSAPIPRSNNIVCSHTADCLRETYGCVAEAAETCTPDDIQGLCRLVEPVFGPDGLGVCSSTGPFDFHCRQASLLAGRPPPPKEPLPPRIPAGTWEYDPTDTPTPTPGSGSGSGGAAGAGGFGEGTAGVPTPGPGGFWMQQRIIVDKGDVDQASTASDLEGRKMLIGTSAGLGALLCSLLLLISAFLLKVRRKGTIGRFIVHQDRAIPDPHQMPPEGNHPAYPPHPKLPMEALPQQPPPFTPSGVGAGLQGQLQGPLNVEGGGAGAPPPALPLHGTAHCFGPLGQVVDGGYFPSQPPGMGQDFNSNPMHNLGLGAGGQPGQPMNLPMQRQGIW